MRRIILAGIVVGTLWYGIFWLADQAAGASTQGRLSRAATSLSGRPVRVSCALLDGLEGQEQDGAITLDLSACEPLLHRYLAGPAGIDAAEGSAALAHEIGHVVRGGCEYDAEQYAMSHWRRLYRVLEHGTPDPIAVGYVVQMHRDLPAIYHTPC